MPGIPTFKRSSAFSGSTSAVTRSICPFTEVMRTRLAHPCGNKADSNHKLVMPPITPAVPFAILSR